MRATQSLALLLCLREAVYPREPWVLEETDQQLVHNQSADWWTDNYASKHPGVVNDWLAQRGMKDERSRLVGSGKLGAILSHVLACGRASQALTALRCMNRERDLRTLCKSACEETFPSLLRNAAYSQVDDVYELVKLLQGLGLRVHSRVLATVLPFDGFTLERLTRRSMHFTVDYLDQCKEADSAVFRAVLSKDKDLDRLPRGLSAIVTDAALDNKKRDLAGRPLPVKCNPGNMGRLLTLLPTETTKAYIGELDHRDHTVWLSRHSPRSWPNYISATWEYVEARQREPLGRALCTALEDFDLDKMSDFIYRCDQFDVLKYSQVQACLDIILRRVDVERPESLEQYIWEAASAAHKPTKYRGVKLAKSELNKSLTDESRYALIGTLAALDERSIIKSLSSDIKPTPERATEFFSTWDYAGVPIWKKYRVVAGQHAANLEQALPPDLIAHVKELRSRVKIRPTTTQVSKRLLGIVERVVA